uniref:NADH-ubiquinone oxidoreductase chain 6 n=1 Tax=Omalium rivulare TaxID=347419 RepID=A0A0S2MP49_9COLE|nr:NADH deshydrogenase subunit 6 [Omalium rivulare]
MSLILLSSSIILSMIFLFLNHPLSMGMILLIQTLCVALITGLKSVNFWYSYILFLIMVGGMLVLFMYMTSIASNEKFKFSSKISMMIIMLTVVMSIIILNNDLMLLTIMDLLMNKFNNFLNYQLSLNKFLNFPSNLLLFILIVYLFITLIAVVKISNIKSGTLRQKF